MIQTIFIPILFVCMNNNCEFMQAQIWYKSEQQCRSAVDAQKDNLRKMAAKGDATIIAMPTIVTIAFVKKAAFGSPA